MCHRIRQTSSFFAMHDKYLVGIKGFLHKSGKIFSLHTENKYNFYENDDYYIIIEAPKEQILEISFPVRSDSPTKLHSIFTKEIKITAGIHIYSLNDNMELSVFASSHVIYIPVLFDMSDVLFFDGMDISVQRLLIPKKNVASEIINKLPKYGRISIDNKKEFMNHYQKFCNDIEKQIKLKKQKRRKHEYIK